MCLVVFCWDAHPRYRLVLGANRDEFHARPTTPLAQWPQGFIAGRDERAGGTWLGVAADGRWALVTNIRSGEGTPETSRSRGDLPVAYLSAQRGPVGFVANCELEEYGPVNLLVGSREELVRARNRPRLHARVEPGIHGLSNGDLDEAWPKVTRTLARFRRTLNAQMVSPEAIFDLLRDRRQSEDNALPRTGVARSWERMLSAPFIVSPKYGTRCSSVVTLERDGPMRIWERRFDCLGTPIGTRCLTI